MALHDEFDPNRRLHGWARSGMTMDGEDFIDLAKVSKRVPGKTPAQVSKPSRGSIQYIGAPFVMHIKFDFTVDEGKEWLNPSRDKNQGTHRRRKVD